MKSSVTTATGDNAAEDNADDQEFSDADMAKIWRTILKPGSAEDEQFANKYYNWRRPVDVPGLLHGQPRIWMSWGYKAAYPKLAIFLEKASLDNKFRSQVILEEIETNNDRYQRRKFRYNEAHAPLSVVFDALKTFPTQVEEAKPFTEKVKVTAVITRLARILHITDISPLVLSCIFGTTSSLDISHIAAFVNRNLSGSNWAKVNLLQIRHIGYSSFIYEYHFSFYYVTLDYFEAGTIKPDLRKSRRSCTFGQGKNGKHRYIHEETVSFLLCGHFNDVFCCYQLGDAYFKPRYTKSTGPRVFRSYDPKQSPGQLLLYWIAVALFHARSRWENAIDSLDSEIRSPSDVVFMEDRNDLMADDPQFSLSKTYFWAMQTYKLFERTLEQTITTWENFKKDSLPKIRDGRICHEDWDAGVGSIDQAIEHLKLKIDRVRRGIQDVKDLREGLQSTAAVFDSRTAVRQGENIRLLTYITLLFLPLSFGTGIFGMQIIERSPETIKAFAITLPCITVVTALLIFNLNTIMSTFSSLVRNTTFGLQNQMRLHYRKDWKDRALALHQDHLSTEPPARKAAKQSSHWVYILFLIEGVVVILPVSELDAAFHCYGLFGADNESFREDDSELSDVDTKPRDKKRRELQNKVKRAAERAKEQEQRRQDKARGTIRAFSYRFGQGCLQMATVLVQVIFGTFRAFLLPIWIILLTIEYAMVTIALVLTKHRSAQLAPLSDGSRMSSEPKHSTSSFARAWRILGLDMITFPRRHSSRHVDASDDLAPAVLPETRPWSKRQQAKKYGVLTKQKLVKQFVRQHSFENNPGPLPPRLPRREETIDPVYTSGAHEISTFAEQPRSITTGRMWRATHYASQNQGYIPGDFARPELSGGPEHPTPVGRGSAYEDARAKVSGITRP